MSDIDDCASQEIEASDSSVSTKNSKKHSFVQAILSVDRSQNICARGKQNFVLGSGIPGLPELKKCEFIHNWILAHDVTATSPKKLCSGTPVLGTIQCNSPGKRAADSLIHDYQWKRARLDNNAKENFRISSNVQSRQAARVQSTARAIAIIENDAPRNRESVVLMNTSNGDSDKTYTNSPVFNGNTSSSTLNASVESYKFSGDRASNESRSVIRESSKIPETLSSLLEEIERSDVDRKNTKYCGGETNNGRRSEASVQLSWIAGEQSPIKEARRVSRSNHRRSLDQDNYQLSDKISSSSPFGSSNDVEIEKDLKIDKLDRLTRRLSWLRAKNGPIKIESATASKINNHQRIVRQSSKLTDTLSVSSRICESDCIDVESSTTNPAEEEIKIETDSDDTRSDVIENVETQNPRALLLATNICKIENAPSISDDRRFDPRRDLSRDSDATYYSDADRVPSIASSLKYSQRISQQKSDIFISQVASPLRQNCEPTVCVVPSQDKSNIHISQANSPFGQNSKITGYVAPLNTSNDHNAKKKKAKKGTLLAKLQSLVSSQASHLRIWRHQMSQPNFKDSHTQYVTLRVRERETRWGRHYITASVIADTHNLLKNLFTSRSNATNENSVSLLRKRTVTLMIVPEVTGRIKIRADSTLNIYPPWDIMSRDKMILNIVYFDVIANLANVDDASEKQPKREIERIVQTFDCPCIRENAIVDSCTEKFTERKPSVMQALFGSGSIV